MEPAAAPRRLSGRRLARAALVVVAALAACGGRAPPPSSPPPPPSPRARACEAYNRRISPFLRRFDAALALMQAAQRRAGEDATARGDAAAGFADRVVAELPGLRAIGSRDPVLAAAHRQLVRAVEEVARGHEQLAAAYALADAAVRRRALDRLAGAWRRWSEASRALVGRCRQAPQPAASAASSSREVGRPTASSISHSSAS